MGLGQGHLWLYGVQVVKRTDAHRLKVLPQRWIVERTFAWLNHFRRLSKDYELRPDTVETMVKITWSTSSSGDWLEFENRFQGP